MTHKEARPVERDMQYLPDIRDLEGLIGDYRSLRRDTHRVVQRLRTKGQVGAAVYDALSGAGGDVSVFDLLSAAVDGTQRLDSFSLKDALEALSEGDLRTAKTRYSYDRRS
jgi:hypothetical protein